ncbi:MAG: hypothetical protein ACFFE2_10290, partial [Candidatus Thorarchaeota archaeon]
MSRNGQVCLLVVFLGLMLLSLGVVSTSNTIADVSEVSHPDVETTTDLNLERQSVVSYINHDPIYIEGDSEFLATAAAEGWPGDGTSGNPIRITELRIESTVNDENCIFISSTSLYFVIESCYLSGATGVDLYGEVGGIHLVDVMNGHILNNVLVDNSVGIGLGITDISLSGLGSSQIIIERNTINYGGIGVGLFSSSFNTIFHNNILGGSIFLWRSSDNTVEQTESVDSRIENHGSSRNVIRNNELGIGQILVRYILDRETSEVIGSHELTITNNGVSAIDLLGSNDTLVDMNTVSFPGGQNGIMITECARTTLSNNEVFDSSLSGLIVAASQDI